MTTNDNNNDRRCFSKDTPTNESSLIWMEERSNRPVKWMKARGQQACEVDETNVKDRGISSTSAKQEWRGGIIDADVNEDERLKCGSVCMFGKVRTQGLALQRRTSRMRKSSQLMCKRTMVITKAMFKISLPVQKEKTKMECYLNHGSNVGLLVVW